MGSLCFSSKWSPVTEAAVPRSRVCTTLWITGPRPWTLDWSQERACFLPDDPLR